MSQGSVRCIEGKGGRGSPPEIYASGNPDLRSLKGAEGGLSH
jgi:hypothetical protein